MMKAMRISEFNKNAKLQMGDVQIPEVRSLDVLAEIHAASVNPLDIKIRNGLRAGYPLPLTMGSDFAGIVVKTGDGETKFKTGDRVYGRPNQKRIGTFAEYIAADQNDIALIPENLSLEQAAAVPLVGLTSYQMLTEVLQIKPGQKLLIHAGSGGIGSFAIQLAKALGAFVATTTITPNVEWVKALGADIVIDYRQQKFEEELRDYNAVFDTLGGQSLIDSFQVVQKGGKIGSLIGLSGDGAEQRLKELQSETGVSYQYYYMRPDGKQLSRITQYIEQGQIKPVIDRIFPFEEAQQAIEYSESGHAKGKIILKIK